jgi:hypothetical protein
VVSRTARGQFADSPEGHTAASTLAVECARFLIGYYATEAEPSAASARHIEEAGDRSMGPLDPEC